jgi:two-component system NtrC family sensor kinase
MQTYLKTKILFPLSLVFGLLFSAFAYNNYKNLQDEFSHDVERHLEGIQQLFDKQVESETELLSSILGLVAKDERLQKAWTAKDRNSLLKLSAPLLKEMGAKHRITHFYFHNPDRTSFLRVYDPDRFDDVVNRFTLLETVRTGQISAGIELGKLGTLTLRVVHPWQINGKIVGYIEMGEEIDHIIEKLHNILDVELYISIYKSFLKEENWKAGMRLLNRQNDWNFSPYAVIVNQSLKNIPESLNVFLEKGKHEYMEMATDLKLSIDQFDYRVGVVPLFDAGEREIGDIIILYDVTARLSSFKKTILIIVGYSALAGLLLFVFFSVYLGKLESQIIDYQNNLELTVKDRTRELTDALSEIKTLRGIIPICSNCKEIRDDEGMWSQIETYISDHSEAEFIHGICPNCEKKLYPDTHRRVMKKIEDKKQKAT